MDYCLILVDVSISPCSSKPVEHVDRTAASQPFPAKSRHGFGVRYGPYDWAGMATEVSGLSLDRPMSRVSQPPKMW